MLVLKNEMYAGNFERLKTSLLPVKGTLPELVEGWNKPAGGEVYFILYHFSSEIRR